MNTDPLLLTRLMGQADPEKVPGLSRFFKTGPGQYGEGDRFLGIKVPTLRAMVKECWRSTPLDDIELMIRSPYHEVRMASLFALIQLYAHSKKDPLMQHRCICLYLAHTDSVNNWDLVDLSCYELLGDWLLTRDRSLLYYLAEQGATLWEQRIGIVSTMQFVRHGELDDTYRIADLFLAKEEPLHDLLQKAVGWLLREAGKRDTARLTQYLASRYRDMPRTLLRYAIEKYPEEMRRRWIDGKV